ncbi:MULTISPECIES: transglutaminase family protein [Microbacterium]|uniref:transglutaminase family protein n=1 Tax=Microbacterium TaxID=33882 RepID=UPI0011EADEE1|nr:MULTISPECIES: DUF3488 and transglutaminase-like domain-containing protein [Microbacterium]
MFRADRPRPAAVPLDTRLQWHGEREVPAGVVAPGVLAGAAALTALWPFTSVIAPGAWSLVVTLLVVAVVATGMLMRHLLRRRRVAIVGLLALLAQLLVATALLTLLLAGDTAVLGIVPTPATLALFQALAAAATEQIVFGSAPLAASPGLSAALGAGFTVVAILLDHLIAHRAAVLATVLLGVIGSLPMIVTLGSPNLAWFVVAAVVALLLFRHTARRHPESPRRASGAVAVTVGAAAIATALVVTPLLPVGSTIAGTGVGVTVDASLRLGDDLRQPSPVEVLTVATKAEAAPYLRLTTLSRFDGRVWQPDRGDLQSQVDGFGGAEWGEDIATAEQTTSIRVLRMSSSWLPVPYPAIDVQGLGAAWRVSPENRTLFSRRGDAVGNDYTVTSLRVTPTLEQIRSADAARPVADPDAEAVELPGIIGELAAEVTADEETDYDRLVALQNWFRTQFEYSLETPVEEGFDGTGADAVARFLEERSGYCVHFAGAFALMAESLGMQVRVVVGYLPGALTDEKRGDESIFSVTSDQLHSWPEVLFPGIGWVPFEPTASLGVPTSFRAGTTQGGTTGGPADPAPTTAPQSEETTAPEVDRGDADPGSSGSGELRRLDPTPVVLIAVGVLVLLLVPASIRLIERRLRLRRAAHGDAAAAWAELRDTLVDLRVPVSDAESPRMRSAVLVRDAGADESALRDLTAAVERANYARAADTAEDLAAPLKVVVDSLRRHVDRGTRARALLLPRSLYAPRGADTRLLV